MSKAKLPDYMPDWIREHVEMYLEDGAAAHLWDASSAGYEGKFTTLLLTTQGRKSGEERPIPLIYRPTQTGGYCVIASKGGAPEHPAWYLNLRENPQVHIKVADKEMVAKARDAGGEEREALWREMADYFAPYNDYEKATDREIPVVVLDPV